MCKSHYSNSYNFVVDRLLHCSSTVRAETLDVFKRMLHDFQNGNNGIELSYEDWDYDKKENIKKDYVVKFYRPKTLKISKESKLYFFIK